MKNFLLLSVFIALTTAISGQEIALVKHSDIEIYEPRKSSEKIIPILEETEYTYRYNKSDVVVHFKDGEHIEYFNDKKYFIKSNIEWTASDECYMTIQDSNLPDFPFGKGTKLRMKILKVKNGKVHYESTLGGRTWTGKMKIKK